MAAIGEMEQLANMYGAIREPYKIDPWEVNKRPLSISSLTGDLGEVLSNYCKACKEDILKHAAQAITFLWVMKADGQVTMAVEELADMPDGTERRGFPRRRNYPNHPAEEKKLGHPCLVDGCGARVAGEFFLDEVGGNLTWYVNVSSGRYCRFNPPNQSQAQNVLQMFRSLVSVEVELDDLSKV